AVTKVLRTQIAKLTELDTAAGEHFRDSIETSVFCRYAPATPVACDVVFRAGRGVGRRTGPEGRGVGSDAAARGRCAHATRKVAPLRRTGAGRDAETTDGPRGSRRRSLVRRGRSATSRRNGAPREKGLVR